jgi:hypothetical protein
MSQLLPAVRATGEQPGRRILCSAAGCNTTVAELRGRTLVLRTKHHGQWHESHLSIDMLLELVSETEPEREAA